jgi:pyridoxamine 5'-phosphate oxidase
MTDTRADEAGRGRDIRSILGEVTVFGSTPPPFDPDRAPADPLDLFADWLADAVSAGVPDPNAMTLSTVDDAGVPDARVLILRDATPDGWAFGTSSSSPKGRHLAAHPAAALTFYWPARGRQVRVRGAVTIGSPAEAAESFLARGTGGRAESFLGRQSDVIADPDEPRRALDEVRGRIEADPDLVSPTWTIYRVVPETIEFWQAARDRSHLRLRYRATAGEGGRYATERLWP